MSDGQPRLSVVIPAFEEAGRIGDTVAAVRAALVVIEGDLELVVVDDGSTDATAEEARAAGADRVIVLPTNRGKGAAVRAGMLAARGAAIAFTDADLAYSPDQLLGLLASIEGGADVVVGSRRHDLTTTLVRARRLREIGGRAVNLVTRLVVLGVERDTQCGMKAFTGEAAHTIFERTTIDGFAFDVEVFVIADAHGLRVAEVPVTVANSTRSTVKVVRDAGRLLVDLFRIRLAAHHGRYRPGGSAGVSGAATDATRVARRDG